MTQVEDDFTVQHAPVPEKITPMQLEALEKFIVFGGEGIMATGLPSMAYGDGISKRKQVKFGGYNHTLAAENGDLWDMENLTSDFYPL